MSITPETLAWLRQSAAVNGAAYSQVLLHLLERVEALEQKYETQRLATLEWGKDVDKLMRWIDDHLKRIMVLEAAQQQPHQDKLDRLIELDSDDDAPTPEAAPVATDEDLYLLAYSEPLPTELARLRRCYDLGRQHGGAQPPAAPPAPEAGEVEELMRRLRDWHSIPLLQERERIATLLQQLSAPAQAVVPVAVSDALIKAELEAKPL